MHYYLYEIRNNIDGKIYIGVHKTKVLDDGYMGSGKIIKSAIEKHGIQNFTKTILEFFETQEEMFVKEKEIVNEEFLLREDTYNLRRGGDGGFDYINSDKSKEYYEIRKNAAIIRNLKYGFAYAEWNKKVTKEQRSLMLLDSVSKMQDLGTYKNEAFLGKLHTEETKQRIGKKNSINQSGPKNSQFGSMWVTNGIENKKIKLLDPIPSGWVKGRKLKKIGMD